MGKLAESTCPGTWVGGWQPQGRVGCVFNLKAARNGHTEAMCHVILSTEGSSSRGLAQIRKHDWHLYHQRVKQTSFCKNGGRGAMKTRGKEGLYVVQTVCVCAHLLVYFMSLFENPWKKIAVYLL